MTALRAVSRERIAHLKNAVLSSVGNLAAKVCTVLRIKSRRAAHGNDCQRPVLARFGVAPPHGRDGSVKLWHHSTGKRIYSASADPVGAEIACFSPCGKFVLVPESWTDLVLLRTCDGAELARCTSSSGGSGVMCACFSPDGKVVAVAAQDEGGLVLFTAPDLKRTRQLPVFSESGVASVAFTGATVLVALSHRNAAEIWDVTTSARLFILREALPNNLMAGDRISGTLAVSPDGKYVAATGYTASTTRHGAHPARPVGVWDVATGAPAPVRATGHDDTDDGTAVSVRWLPPASGSVLAICSGLGTICFYTFTPADPASHGKLLSSVEVFSPTDRIAHTSVGGGVSGFCFAPNGSHFACYGHNSAGGALLEVFKAPQQPQPTPIERQGDLLHSKRGADVTLVCRGVETTAHSLVLAMRSGTLQRQLDWGTEQEQQGAAAATAPAAGNNGGGGPRRLEIDAAIEPAILERFLQYLCASRRALSLSPAASRFIILRELCSAHLWVTQREIDLIRLAAALLFPVRLHSGTLAALTCNLQMRRTTCCSPPPSTTCQTCSGCAFLLSGTCSQRRTSERLSSQRTGTARRRRG